MLFDKRFTDLVGTELPIVQAPMAGASDAELAIAVSEAGGLGSLPCAMLSAEQVRASYKAIRERTMRPLNLNFFCHRIPSPDPKRESRWRELLGRYYTELGLEPAASPSGPNRRPFDAAMCDVVEELRPAVVSFHFGLPEKPLLDRVRSTGARIISSATTVEEARWLEAEGCDAVIAQGAEAGGHRGMFLTSDIATQVGTIALTPQIVDAVKIPVIASGGIGDARGIVAAFALGASAVQLGTAYLRCPECRTLGNDECHYRSSSPRHRQSADSRGRTRLS
jgi:nitronate monooxygenase